MRGELMHVDAADLSDERPALLREGAESQRQEPDDFPMQQQRQKRRETIAVLCVNAHAPAGASRNSGVQRPHCSSQPKTLCGPAAKFARPAARAQKVALAPLRLRSEIHGFAVDADSETPEALRRLVEQGDASIVSA